MSDDRFETGSSIAREKHDYANESALRSPGSLQARPKRQKTDRNTAYSLSRIASKAANSGAGPLDGDWPPGPSEKGAQPAIWTILTRERQRLSRDIHDVSGQYIVSMLFRLAALERTVTDSLLLSHFADLRRTLTQFSNELQQIATGERAGVPPGYFLVTSLSDLIERWQNEFGIATQFRHRRANSPDLDDETAKTIYRIVQEALTNIAKHAATASNVSVRLRRMPEFLMLVIEDDGSGASVETTTSHGRPRPPSGIAGMSQRVAELGGTFTIRARRGGKGTRLVATIPLKPFAISGAGRDAS